MIKPIQVRGTTVSPSDSRESYRDKIARITLDSMVQFVGLLDARGTVLEINKVALDAVGINLSEVEGKPFWTTFWWQVSEEINQGLRDAIGRAAQGEFVRWDTPIFGRAGGKETIIIDASLMPVLDDAGKVVFIAAEGRDITEKKAYEREIARQREELAQLDVLKTKFFANVSHEFRTPITLMLGPIEELLKRYAEQDRANSQQDIENLNMVHRNGLRLLKLVNTLLDFSRIEAGRIDASFEPTDLAAFTTELASVFRSAVEKAGLRLIVDCPPLPESVYVDRQMWEKIVLNLLSNAFKFTFEGEIRLGLSWKGETVELTVADTGTGIAPDQLTQVFDRFHRVANARARTHEGTGIGLALVQELSRLHGGHTTVQSVVNQGSVFTVSIKTGVAHLSKDKIASERRLVSTSTGPSPYVEESIHWLPDSRPNGAEKIGLVGEQDSDGAARVFQSGQTPAHILLADDNADMREYVQRLLSQQGYEVTAVPDGEAALASARERLPRLLISDIMMPKLDGMGLLKAFRGDPKLRSVPVILLSARAGEEARVEGLKHGADDYLIKPFSHRELLVRVESHLELARVRRAAAESQRRERERVEFLTDAAQIGVWFCDLPFDKLEWDHRVKEHFWLAPDAEVTIGTFFERLHPEDRERTRLAIEESIDKKSRYDIDYRTVAPDGQTKWIRAIGHSHFDADGNPVRFDGITIDITSRVHTEIERARLERGLQESVEHFRAFVTTSSDAVYRMNADWSEMRFLKGKDFIPDTNTPERGWLEKYIFPKDRPAILAAIKNATAAKTAFELEHPVIRVDGTAGWTFSRAIPLLNSRGEIAEWFGAATDITERRRAEEKLREQTRVLALLKETGTAIAAELDLQTLVQIITDAATKLCGAKFGAFFYNTTNQHGESYVLYTLSGAPREAFEKFGMPRNTPIFNPTFAGEGVMRSDDITGDPRYGKMAPHHGMPKGHLPVRSYLAVPVISRGGGVIGGLFFGHPETAIFTEQSEELVTGIAAQASIAIDNATLYQQAQREIAERRRVAEELQQAREKLSHHAEDLEKQVALRTTSLQEALAQLEEFSYSVSHDLRAPLRAIAGYNKVIREDYSSSLPPDAIAYLDRIERSAYRMERLVNDVLTLSRVARAEINLHPIGLQQFIEDIIEQHPNMQAAAAEINIATPHSVVADDVPLSQALTNLLSNAVKFVDPGMKPRIIVRSEKVGERIRIWVADSGVGIPERHRDKLFGMFQRLPAKSEVEGTGIGLAIVRKAVERMGGTVGMEPNEPKGSRFWIELKGENG